MDGFVFPSSHYRIKVIRIRLCRIWRKTRWTHEIDRHMGTDYVQRVADGSPTPGGGSVCALAGSLSAAYASWWRTLLSARKVPEWVGRDAEISSSAGDLVSRSLELAERDAEAYDGVLSAFKLVQESQAQKEARRRASRQP